MSISLNQDRKEDLEDHKELISRIFRHPVKSISRINEGRNSRVYLIVCGDSGKYVAKAYFAHESDKRDRLSVEFSSIRFLWGNGIRCIPKPMSIHKKDNVAFYEYVEGDAIGPQSITAKDIDEACSFLFKLDELGKDSKSNVLPAASDACFSFSGIIESIAARHNRLLASRSDEKNHALHEFLTEEFEPEFKKIGEWCRASLSGHGMGYLSELEKEKMTLSPSDFGFHNAVRGKNGIVFLDFEYFGWDDPAKTISDFLLHPNMNMDLALKKRFVRNMLAHFQEGQPLRKRLAVAYPLYGLKWSLILLNEFLPENFLRRRFANEDMQDKEDIQREQLSKARQMLQTAVEGCKGFTYGD